MLSPPEAFTLKVGERVRDSMQHLIKGQLDIYYPPVLISYATGTRDTKHGHERDVDAPGCGPGMAYCMSVCHQMDARGIDTFSGLMMILG